METEAENVDVTHLIEWDIAVQDCDMCANADREGWWGLGGNTHCRKCHRTWRMASKQAHCVTCCEHFSSPSTFDIHLAPIKYGETCYHPSNVVNSKTGQRLLVQREDGVWIRPMSPERESKLWDDRNQERATTE